MARQRKGSVQLDLRMLASRELGAWPALLLVCQQAHSLAYVAWETGYDYSTLIKDPLYYGEGSGQDVVAVVL